MNPINNKRKKNNNDDNDNNNNKRKKNNEVNLIDKLYSSAYCNAFVIYYGKTIPIYIVIDTGSTDSIVSKRFLDDFQISFDNTRTKSWVGVDVKNTTLGLVTDLLIKIGDQNLCINNLVVTKGETYSIIIGSVFLRKIKAIIDYDNLKMSYTFNDKKYQVPFLLDIIKNN